MSLTKVKEMQLMNRAAEIRKIAQEENLQDIDAIIESIYHYTTMLTKLRAYVAQDDPVETPLLEGTLTEEDYGHICFIEKGIHLIRLIDRIVNI